MNRTFFSFIIPHKNTPHLLQKCLDSIPHRDDVQIIIVDDNSDPEKVDFDNFPGLGEPNTEVFLTKEGRGAGYARNIGLKHARGKWIVFADADDFFNPGLTSAMEEFVDCHDDIIFFKGNAIKYPSGEASNRGTLYYSLVEEALLNKDYTKLLIYTTPCRKFYSAEFLQRNSILFNESKWGNDVVFCARVAVTASKCFASPIDIYCVTESDFGLTTNPSLEAQIVRFEQESEAISLLRNKFKENDLLHYWYFKSWFNVYRINKFVGIKVLPTAIISARFHFIKEVFKALK